MTPGSLNYGYWKVSKTEKEEINEWVDHCHEQPWSILEELLRTVGNVFQNCPPETKRGAFTHRLSSANGWELPYGANSLTLPSCSHVTANGLLQEPQTWGPEKAQTYLERGQHRISGKWYSTVPHSPGWNQTEAWSDAVNVSATTHGPAPTFLFQPPLTLWLHSNHTSITAAGLYMFPPTKGPLNMLFPAPGILSPSLFVQCPRLIHQDSSLTSVSLGSLPWLSKPW